MWQKENGFDNKQCYYPKQWGLHHILEFRKRYTGVRLSESSLSCVNHCILHYQFYCGKRCYNIYTSSASNQIQKQDIYHSLGMCGHICLPDYCTFYPFININIAYTKDDDLLIKSFYPIATSVLVAYISIRTLTALDRVLTVCFPIADIKHYNTQRKVPWVFTYEYTIYGWLFQCRNWNLKIWP